MLPRNIAPIPFATSMPGTQHSTSDRNKYFILLPQTGFVSGERAPRPQNRFPLQLRCLDTRGHEGIKCLNLSRSAQHLIVAVFYATGPGGYSGATLPPPLRLPQGSLFARRSVPLARHLPDHQSPAFVLARGIRQKDRLVIAVGAIAAILTVISNKSYLGWQRHTWDPMLLGILLTGVAVFIRRWLVRGPGGIRHGFTAERLSGKDKSWMNAGSAVFGVLTPESITPAPQTSGPDFRFGGGASGGGGAGGDF